MRSLRGWIGVVLVWLSGVAVWRVAHAEDAVELAQSAVSDLDRAKKLIADHQEGAVPPAIEKEILDRLNACVENSKRLLELDASNKAKHSERIREARSCLFWYRRLQQKIQTDSTAAGSTEPAATAPTPEAVAKSAEEKAQILLAIALKHEAEHPDDYWGHKANYQAVAACYGAPSASAATAKISEYERRIVEWQERQSLQEQAANADTVLGRLEAKLTLTAGGAEFQALRKRVRELVQDRDLIEAETVVNERFAQTAERFAERDELSRMQDYLLHTGDLFACAKLGARMSKGATVPLTFLDGSKMDAAILDVGPNSLVVACPAQGIRSMEAGLFRFNDDTIRRLAKVSGARHLNRCMLAHYILMDEIEAAAGVLKKAPDSETWKKTYGGDVSRRERIAGVEKEIRKEKQRIDKIDDAFAALFKKIDKKDYDKEINRSLYKVMDLNPDLLDEDLLRNDAACQDRFHIDLVDAIGNVRTLCNTCRQTRQVTCTNCNGKGKIINPGIIKSASNQWITCPTCKGGGKMICPHCHHRVNAIDDFVTLPQFQKRVRALLRPDEGKEDAQLHEPPPGQSPENDGAPTGKPGE